MVGLILCLKGSANVGSEWEEEVSGKCHYMCHTLGFVGVLFVSNYFFLGKSLYL